METKERKVGFYAPIVNIVICLIMIGLVCVMLFGQTIVDRHIKTFTFEDGADVIPLDEDVARMFLYADDALYEADFVYFVRGDGNVVVRYDSDIMSHPLMFEAEPIDPFADELYFVFDVLAYARLYDIAYREITYTYIYGDDDEEVERTFFVFMAHVGETVIPSVIINVPPTIILAPIPSLIARGVPIQRGNIATDVILEITENIRLNLSALQGYLPLDVNREANDEMLYTIGGIQVEPQAIILVVLIFALVVSLALSIWRAVLLIPYMRDRNKHRLGEVAYGRVRTARTGMRVASLIVMIVAVGAIGMFIFTYGVAGGESALFSDLHGFFREVWSAGLIAWENVPQAGVMLVMTSYALVAVLGICSYVLAQVNK